MKVQVDNEVCQGHGRCYTLSPTVFDPDVYGYAVVRTDAVEPDVEKSVRDAVESCPERAIRLVET